jgi:protein AaeX
MTRSEIDIFGVFVPGLLLVVLAGLILSFLLARLLAWLGVTRAIWHPELFNIALFVLVLAVLTQILA